jgi:hypothetical protein
MWGRAVLVVAIAGGTAACGSDSTGPDVAQRTFEFDFATGADGWLAGFADYVVGRDEDMGLEARHASLPDEVDRTGGGLFIGGTNISDDLFMFWKRRVTGLQPNTRYRVSFEVEFATDAPSGCVGIGGAPGESVHVKAGVSTQEPSREVEQVGGTDTWRMTIDKGNQATGGPDAGVIGHVGNTNTDCTNPLWELKTVSGNDVVEVRTDASGAAWLIVGTDSGFEGRTELYYTYVRAEFDRI